MKSLRNKVILSGIVLVFAFIATIGSTYAWFTVSSSTEIESLNLTVTAAENLLIMPYDESEDYTTDGGDADSIADFLQDLDNYSTILTLDEIIEAGYLYENISGSIAGEDLAYDTPWRIQPATAINTAYTAVDGVALNDIDTTSRVLSDVGVDYNNSTGYYVQLAFWVYSQADTDRTLKMNSFDITSTDPVGDRALVANSVRLAVWADDTDFGATAVTGDEVIFGITDNFSFSFVDTTAEIVDFNTLDEVAADLTTGTAITSAVAVDSVYTVAELSSAPSLLTIESVVPTLIFVNIFIEGWSTDAANYIADAVFNIEFSFIIE